MSSKQIEREWQRGRTVVVVVSDDNGGDERWWERKGCSRGNLLGYRVEEVVVEREGSSDSFRLELDSRDSVAFVALNGWPFTRDEILSLRS
ncbi:hypothetical protein DY000_02008799 [Brassica cretica]|uniref:Uncharacterized protein n=1 Tax=Brassica cretica TaxID=69181 RepID=A0ABQ7C5L1_BRACR|nr:hypothetical protein DY000_02008799 [Brassica cretica]